MSTCNDCEYCKDKVNGVGKCKFDRVETHITPDTANRVIVRENGWPEVSVTEEACGKFELNGG